MSIQNHTKHMEEIGTQEVRNPRFLQNRLDQPRGYPIVFFANQKFIHLGLSDFPLEFRGNVVLSLKQSHSIGKCA